MSQQLSYTDARTADAITDAVMSQMVEPRTDWDVHKIFNDVHKIAPNLVKKTVNDLAKTAHDLDNFHKGLAIKFNGKGRKA
jgi:excinuclease UvrABC helicase subunit UvrB